VGHNCQVSSKSVNRKWVNGRGHRTDTQTDTQSDNKGRLELSGAREPTDKSENSISASFTQFTCRI